MMFQDEEERVRYHQMVADKIANLKKLSKEKREIGEDEFIQGVLDEQDNGGIVDVDIKIPLRNNFVNVAEKFLLQAEREKKLLRITVPDGSALWKPEDWRKTGQITFQKFNYQTPMKLIGNYVFGNN